MVFFQSSFSSIFNNNIATVLDDSIKVAETYHDEYKERIMSDVKSISTIINQNFSGLITDTRILKELLESYTNLKELSDAVIFIPSRNIIVAKNDFSFGLIFDYIPKQIIEEATIEKPILIQDSGSNKIRALIRLDNFSYPTYLMIGKYMDEKVLNYIAETKKATSSYNILTKKIHNLQTFFLLIFVGVLFLLLFTTKFIARFLSKKLTKPLGDVVSAIQEISDDNILIKVRTNTNITELNFLSYSFNLMTEKLNKSNKQIISRSNFIEAILNQIPDGLVIFRVDLSIIIQNNSAKNIINSIGENKDLFFRQVQELIFNDNLEKEHTINIDEKSFLIKITLANFEDEDNKNYLVTFTDITEHIAYQKNLLWVEVAKRITHEIRNPLTPIILSAERLEEKYSDFFTNKNEAENFQKYLNSIKKHVEDIASIIDEFVQFGRMPQAVIKKRDLVTIIKSTISTANFDKKINYSFNSDFTTLIVDCDEKQIARVLLNLFKNSYEAMQEINNKKISIDLKTIDKIIILTIQDNGSGFPEKFLHKITQPYVSTKAKGSGLGLAIVKKILDDHNWQINFQNQNGGLVTITIPVS